MAPLSADGGRGRHPLAKWNTLRRGVAGSIPARGTWCRRGAVRRSRLGARVGRRHVVRSGLIKGGAGFVKVAADALVRYAYVRVCARLLGSALADVMSDRAGA